MQRTVAVIHTDRLKRNFERIKKSLDPKTEIMAVMKGDAYGHGIETVYPTLKACGVQYYAVAIWQEGVALRQCGALEENILILGDVWDEDLPLVVKYRLTPTIFALDTAQKLNDIAETMQVVQPIHIKIDTGMNRIGFKPTAEQAEIIMQIGKLPNLEIAGLFTHFARADELDHPATESQLAAFHRMETLLGERHVEIPMIHLANSPSIMLRPEVQCGLVRAGDVLFGLCPVDECIWEKSEYEEVLTWETYVVMVKTVPAGEPVGYGGTYVTSKETVIATLPVGFADGYSRKLSNKGYVIIKGKKAPVIGRVCMDQMMVDVTDIPDVKRGDPVQLLDGDRISILTMAELMDANVDEIVTGISKRVPRMTAEEDAIQ